MAITAWEILPVMGNAGVFNPTATQYTVQEATDGSNVAFSNGPTIRQILGDNLAANTTYNLSVDIGDRLDNGTPQYTVSLFAGGVLLASITEADFPTTNGLFTTATLSFAFRALHPLNWDNLWKFAFPQTYLARKPTLTMCN